MQSVRLSRKKFIFAILAVVFVFLLILFLGKASRPDGKDRGDGFRITQTSQVQQTKPSSTPVYEQPCSLVNKDEASKLLMVPTKKLEEPESSQPDTGTLRCRFAATSDDGKLYLVLNIYVFTKQSDYNLIREAHRGKEISTTLDDGFYYQITTTRQSENFVAVRDGNQRLGISASIAVINGNDKLQDFSYTLTDTSALATQLSKIHVELNN